MAPNPLNIGGGGGNRTAVRIAAAAVAAAAGDGRALNVPYRGAPPQEAKP